MCASSGHVLQRELLALNRHTLPISVSQNEYVVVSFHQAKTRAGRMTRWKVPESTGNFGELIHPLALFQHPPLDTREE